MFTPNLDLEVITRCTKFRIIDKTGVDTGDGDKWDGVAGLNRTSVTYAVVRITDTDGNYSDYDVLSQIPDPVTGNITFSPYTGSGEDGLHTLTYRIKTGSVSISAFADYDGTVAGTTLITATAHGLVTGQYIEISGTTNYDGEYYVTKVDANTFYIAKAFVADDGASTGTEMYISNFYPYVWCEAEAGIDKMYANAAFMAAGETRTQYLEDANTAKGLLNSLRSSVKSGDSTTADGILEEINQILSINSVDPEL